jgi:type II secretion system protein N
VLSGLREWTKKKPKGIWLVLGFLFYGLFLFAFFLVWTFPYERLEKRLLVAIETALSCRVEVGKETFLFPLGLRWEKVSLNLPGYPSPWPIDRVQAKAELLPLLISGRGEVDWSMKGFGGGASGHLRIVRRGEGDHFQLDATRADLELGEFHKKVSGMVHIDLEGEWERRMGLGRGSAKIQGEKLTVKEIPAGPLPISSVTVSQLSGRVILRDNRLFFEGITAQGDQADLSGGGNVLLQNPYPGSLLTLSFRVTPKGTLSEMAGLIPGRRSANDPLQVSITGTLAFPRVQVNGMMIN